MSLVTFSQRTPQKKHVVKKCLKCAGRKEHNGADGAGAPVGEGLEVVMPHWCN